MTISYNARNFHSLLSDKLLSFSLADIYTLDDSGITCSLNFFKVRGRSAKTVKIFYYCSQEFLAIGLGYGVNVWVLLVSCLVPLLKGRLSKYLHEPV